MRSPVGAVYDQPVKSENSNVRHVVVGFAPFMETRTRAKAHDYVPDFAERQVFSACLD